MGELLGNYRRLKAVGIMPVWCINHGITTSIYYADHDGTMLELTDLTRRFAGPGGRTVLDRVSLRLV